MTVYLLGVLISVLFAIIAAKVKTKFIKRIMFVLSFLPLFIISAVRYDVGTDYLYRYYKIFNIIKSGGNVLDLEIGFVFLNKLCLLFSDKFYWIFVLTSFIIISLIYYIIYKKSEYYWLSILILFLELFYFQSMNIVRQYVSISLILFFTYMFLFKGKRIKFYFGVLITYFIHSSSVICLILPFLRKIKIFTLTKLIILSTIIYLIGTVFSQDILNTLFNTKYSVYLVGTYNRSDVRLLPFIINFIIYLLLEFLYKRKKTKKNNISAYDNFYINVQAITILCFVLGYVHFLFFRLAYYFSIFNIISIPYFIKNSLDKKSSRFLVMAFILIILTINIVYSNVIHNDEEVLPYHSIYELNIEL